MALQQVANKMGLRLSPMLTETNFSTSNATITINAAGESYALIGRMMLEGGTGSKTISSSGGIIYLATGSITWANAGTNLSVGIQDVVVTTGIEDTTFDVKADYVPGTDTLTGSAVNAVAMDNGTKTINHGDIVAVVVEMTARGGADSITVSCNASSDGMGFPYSTKDTGSGPAIASTDVPGFTVKFDDGTYGWIDGTYSAVAEGPAFNSDSTPDERALVFQLPFESSIAGASVVMGGIASGDTFEIVLYSTPLGTPGVVEAVAVDPDLTATGLIRVSFAPYTLSANTKYAVSVRPTSATNINLGQANFGASNGDLRKPTALGTNWSLGTRSGQTGAFSEDTTVLPFINLYLDKFHDGASSGGPAHFI